MKSRNSISLGSRAETRSQEKISVIEERENVSPVALTEAQLKNRSIFTEKAYANVKLIHFGSLKALLNQFLILRDILFFLKQKLKGLSNVGKNG